jgi:hypothetical protein
MVIVRLLVDEQLPDYQRAFHARFLSLCQYVQISATVIFAAELASGIPPLLPSSSVERQPLT